jgi:Fe-S-cluster containining protein
VNNLFLPKAPGGASVCAKHACTFCCRDTNMPLTFLDLERLIALGHKPADFSEPDEQEGYLRLRNTPEGNCTFLSKEGRCSVQADKPEGCRLYPFIYDEDNDAVIRDGLCPFNREFFAPPGVERNVRELIQRLEAEAQWRKAAASRALR